MANNYSGSNAKNSSSSNQKFISSSSSATELDSIAENLTTSTPVSLPSTELIDVCGSSTTGSALIQERILGEKSPHINQYWAYSQLPQQNNPISQPINTSGSTGTVFSRAQDNVSLPTKEFSHSGGLVGPGERTGSEESSNVEPRSKDADDYPSPKDKDKDEDNVGQDSVCQSPPCAIVPLGTGNDLARVLRWGSGYAGGEDALTLLKDVIDAEEIRLDRWTVNFRSDEATQVAPIPNAVSQMSSISGCLTEGSVNPGAAGQEDNAQIYVMNNYFGIGIDADLCLGFHNAREENPDKFNSRFHNKSVYVKMGLRKMVSRKTWKELHKEIKVEVDGKIIQLPPVEGIIILNILSWGSGANPWGQEKEDNFAKPTHYDGMLEIVGVTGVVHMGQIQSGLRSAIRIAQGGHVS
ncbi:hypothetical protein RND71_044225 [Anisodus tanguticus]|uniref:Diacylglycerol kinase n=1 Tax=Anisodus tanguticus TaxID=243964 RepID=A0AAE1QPP1_9SOLA|nr:hypothetical protein RND71_044225 [Anisodus tanguticus]